MSRGKWPRPTPAEIKRVIKANLDLGLTVTSVRVDEHGVTVSTQPPTGIVPRGPTTGRWSCKCLGRVHHIYAAK